MSCGSVVKITALPCRAAASATQACVPRPTALPVPALDERQGLLDLPPLLLGQVRGGFGIAFSGGKSVRCLIRPCDEYVHLGGLLLVGQARRWQAVSVGRGDFRTVRGSNRSGHRAVCRY